MKVIVASMPKNGTKSVCSALTILGYRVYDWMENFMYLGDDWLRLTLHGVNVDGLRQMYENVDAVTDAPCLFYWEELLEAFPQAKVILVVRDDEDAWCRSLANQFNMTERPIQRFMLAATRMLGRKLEHYRDIVYRCFGYRRDWPWEKLQLYQDEALKRIYHKHNKTVQQNTPPSQLLVINLNQLKWKPICEFLQLPVPDQPFPHKNKRGEISEEMAKLELVKAIRLECRVIIIVLVLLFAYGVSLFVQFFLK